jgi:hypothetical protein
LIGMHLGCCPPTLLVGAAVVHRSSR